MTTRQVGRGQPAPTAGRAALIAIVAGVGGCCGRGAVDGPRGTTDGTRGAVDGTGGTADGTGGTADGTGVASACRLDEAPEVVREDGAAVLLRWELDARPVLFSPALPDDAGYRAYRRAIRDAGAALREPIADRTPPRTDRERETWRREDHNAALVFDGRAGTVRPIGCLEALMFARQHARFSELTQPTELIALVLRRGDRLRLYFGAGDQLFPPKTVYGFDEAAADVAAGWALEVALHNHTILRRGDQPALGTPTLSTNDVHLFRNKVDDLGLRSAWVTNGVYTAEIPAADLDQFLGPPE